MVISCKCIYGSSIRFFNGNKSLLQNSHQQSILLRLCDFTIHLSFAFISLCLFIYFLLKIVFYIYKGTLLKLLKSVYWTTSFIWKVIDFVTSILLFLFLLFYFFFFQFRKTIHKWESCKHFLRELYVKANVLEKFQLHYSYYGPNFGKKWP